ncbi:MULTISPECIES: diguanylate cyclase domain-containing protein [unclassified Paenibacillus]|uniref:diguanylate cyclase domain-containing protein n=1 Tax=unclassified Paenibacillus TaxID=185978 RepID=UPI0036292A15
MPFEGNYNYYLIALTVVIAIIASFLALKCNKLEKMAYTDAMSGLANRNEMKRFFDKQNGKESIAILFLDLDQFKAINDTLGHNIGDLLVKAVGSRLHSFITGKQQVFRIGGDEFLIISIDCLQDGAELLAKQIFQKIKEPYFLEGNELTITGSIGISIGSVQGSDHSILLKAADIAMYRAKGLGRDQYYVYQEETGIQADQMEEDD